MPAVTALQPSELDVTRVSGSLGAEVRGIALSSCGEAEADVLRSLLAEHLVLSFPTST